MTAPKVMMYGGGRQSIATIVLIIQGKVSMPDIVCIADTGREKETTWNYLRDHVQPAFPKQIHIIKKSDFATVDLWGGADKDTLLIPAWTRQSGKLGKLETFCSNEWKARVCDRWLKKVCGIKKWQTWFGFSIDEPKRWKHRKRLYGDSQYFPLVETVPTTKQGCVGIVESFGWPPPIHSACWMCPLQDDNDWLDNTPQDQQRAIDFDNNIRKIDPHVFVHHSGIPLSEVIFKRTERTKEPCDSGLCML